VFERHGIRNVAVAPLGVDSGFFVPRSFGFLSVMTGFGHRGSRANWADIVEGYRKEFRGQDDVRLTIAGPMVRKPFEYAGVRESVALLLDDVRALLRRRVAGDPPLEVIEAGGLPPEEVRALYQQNDCYVSYSREGWGLPILEAMACGLDIVACDYGAPMAYLAGSPARLFAAGRLSADNLEFEGGDSIGLRAHMRAAYEDRRGSRKWVQAFNWKNAAAGIASTVRAAKEAWKARD
jgi:glycosyltransferase involved in cell wall biosynthesis